MICSHEHEHDTFRLAYIALATVVLQPTILSFVILSWLSADESSANGISFPGCNLKAPPSALDLEFKSSGYRINHVDARDGDPIMWHL